MECKEMTNKFGFEPMLLNNKTPSGKCVIQNKNNKNFIFFNNNKNSIEMSNEYKSLCKLNNKPNIK